MALDPKAFKAYDVRGIYPSELDEAGAYAVGPRLRRAVRAEGDCDRTRHARLVPVDRQGGHAGGRRRRRRGQGRRDDRHRDALFRGRRARPRRRRHDHRLAQPEGVHRDEDRPPGRSPRRRRFGPPRRPRPGPDDREPGARRRPAGRERGHLPRFRRARPLLHRRRRGQAASGRHRRRERHGGRDAAAHPRAPARGRGALLLRAGRHLSRTTRRTRFFPRTASSSSAR